MRRAGVRYVDREKIGCTAQTLNEWVTKAETDSGRRTGIPTEIAEKMKVLEKDNFELAKPTRYCARRRCIL